jgi:hypothetical protein
MPFANAGAFGVFAWASLLVASSVADIAITPTLAVGGIAMAPLPALLVAGTLAAAAAFAFVFRKGSDIRASRDHPERAPIINPMHGKPYARAAPLATNE